MTIFLNASQLMTLWRAEAGLTQGELGVLMEIDRRSVRRLERGETPVQKSHLEYLRQLHRQCFTPPPLKVLEQILGDLQPLPYSWYEKEKPRIHRVLVTSQEKPEEVRVIEYDALLVHGEPVLPEDDIFSNATVACSSLSGEWERLWADKWPSAWLRHPER